MVKEYKQALRSSEDTREQLLRENQTLQRSSTMTTPTRGMVTPTRPSSPPDTPSKDIVLEQEPHGAEFEVSVATYTCISMYMYIKLVAVLYNVGWVTDHLGTV